MRWFLLFTLVLASCPQPEDRGRVIEDGQPLCPIVMPMEVVVLDEDLWVPVDNAVVWWNTAAFPSVPFLHVEEPSSTFGLITVGWDMLDPGIGGQTDLLWNDGREIVQAEVVVDAGLEIDSALLGAVLLHELGHCVGLAGDPEGLGSVMQSPSRPGGHLTDHDYDILREGCR
jgi:hypothetical protein